MSDLQAPQQDASLTRSNKRKEDSNMTQLRENRLGLLVATLSNVLLLALLTTNVLAQNYTLNSLFSTNSRLPGLGVSFVPSINNFGDVAYIRRVFNPAPNPPDWVIFLHDGTMETQFFNISSAFGSSIGINSNVVINDAGAVGLLVDAPFSPSCSNLRCLVRINADKSFTVLASANGVGGGGDFAEFTSGLSMNNSGQIAVLARRESDGTNQIVRIDGPGQFTVIFTQTASLFNPTWPSINDSGRVAFAASEPATPGVCGGNTGLHCTSVYSGTGGPLTNEGRRPPGAGNSGHSPKINNNGLVLDTGGFPALIYTAQNGLVNTLVVGNEDPVFGTLSIATRPSQNDFGDYVFGSAKSGFPSDFGLFTGNDPTQDKVVRKGDVLFGGTFTDIPGSQVFQTGLHYINNFGQIVFALTVTDPRGNFFTHIVRAESNSAGRGDGSDVPDGEDICQVIPNPGQFAGCSPSPSVKFPGKSSSSPATANAGQSIKYHRR